MIRIFTLLAIVASVTACAQYREPSANCFSFMAVAPVQPDCDFERLRGPEQSVGVDA